MDHDRIADGDDEAIMISEAVWCSQIWLIRSRRPLRCAAIFTISEDLINFSLISSFGREQ